MNSRLTQVLKMTTKSLWSVIPMLLAVIGLIGLFQALITPQMLQRLFTGSSVKDTLIGTFAGGISLGQPFLSYIIGGKLLHQGVSLYGVTSFILAFTTLGMVQLPLEVQIFGKRFTIVRNLLVIIFSLIVSIATVFTLELIS